MNKKGWRGGGGVTNVAILLGRDYSNTLPVRFEALLGYTGNMVSHNFPVSRSTLVKANQVSPYLEPNLGPHS